MKSRRMANAMGSLLPLSGSREPLVHWTSLVLTLCVPGLGGGTCNVEPQRSLHFCFFVILWLLHFLGLWFANSKNPLELDYDLKDNLLQGHVGAHRI